MENLPPFLKRYLQERYGVDFDVYLYWPYWSPKSYEQIRELDRKGTPSQVEKHMQMYISYDTDLRPHPEFGKKFMGYCEAVRGRQIRPEDMMYVEMFAYDPQLPIVGNQPIHEYYAEVSRRITHELDHRMLAYLDMEWIDRVERAHGRPLVRWDMGKGAVYFSQVDARTV